MPESKKKKSMPSDLPVPSGASHTEALASACSLGVCSLPSSAVPSHLLGGSWTQQRCPFSCPSPDPSPTGAWMGGSRSVCVWRCWPCTGRDEDRIMEASRCGEAAKSYGFPKSEQMMEAAQFYFWKRHKGREDRVSVRRWLTQSRKGWIRGFLGLHIH